MEKTKTIIVSDRRRAYFAVLGETGKWTLGIVTENEPGYHLTKPDSDVGGDYPGEVEANSMADALNKRLGLEPRDAALIVASSIRVSDVKRADDTVQKRPHRERKG